MQDLLCCTPLRIAEAFNVELPNLVERFVGSRQSPEVNGSSGITVL